MHYRRAKAMGGTYFFTVNLADRTKKYLTDYIDTFRDILNNVKQKHPFILDALVLLPDHLHAIWTLPANDYNYATRWKLIKSNFSRQIPRQEKINNSRIKKGERGIWQRRYWEHQIRDFRDYENHINYIHYNPVKHGYTMNPIDWPYSSIHSHISKGIINSDWGANEDNVSIQSFGER